jgi:hypothetical protein
LGLTPKAELRAQTPGVNFSKNGHFTERHLCNNDYKFDGTVPQMSTTFSLFPCCQNFMLEICAKKFDPRSNWAQRSTEKLTPALML